MIQSVNTKCESKSTVSLIMLWLGGLFLHKRVGIKQDGHRLL